jgi:hypothetical protein
VRVEVEVAERKSEVRRVARLWKKRRAITPDALAQIEKLYSDDRSRVGPGFRILLFIFTVVAVLSAFGLLVLARVPWGGLLLLMSIACVMATELQMGSTKRSSSGAEEATAFLAVSFLLGAVVWILMDATDGFPWRMWFFLAALAWTLAAWRWGSWIYGVFAAIAILGMSVFLPATRILWVVTAGLLGPVLLSFSRSTRSTPSHRRACDAALLILLAAVYLAVHLGAYDWRLLEGYRWFGGGEQGPVERRWLFVAGTALMPLVLLVGGIYWRLPIFFRTAVFFGVVSLVTLRFYVHVAPLWVVLTVSGVAALAAALLLRRYLMDGPGGERHGFTAEPLYENLSRTDAVEMGLAASLGSDTREKVEPPPTPYNGGEFGGGGAGRKY